MLLSVWSYRNTTYICIYFPYILVKNLKHPPTLFFFLIQITGMKTNYVICVSFLNKLNFCDVLYSIFLVKIQDLLKNIFVIVVVM